mmetsp:Transcript_44653/g.97143  ORF Transcript_44653/g.97143 Transcript_44653/m.97143 type:complete len:244 (-) Transcript_44653:130-861(-)
MLPKGGLRRFRRHLHPGVLQGSVRFPLCFGGCPGLADVSGAHGSAGWVALRIFAAPCVAQRQGPQRGRGVPEAVRGVAEPLGVGAFGGGRGPAQAAAEQVPPPAQHHYVGVLGRLRGFSWQSHRLPAPQPLGHLRHQPGRGPDLPARGLVTGACGAPRDPAAAAQGAAAAQHRDAGVPARSQGARQSERRRSPKPFGHVGEQSGGGPGCGDRGRAGQGGVDGALAAFERLAPPRLHVSVAGAG